MKPAPFAYYRPASLAQALDLLGSLENARLLAGGQSLVAMLNMRYVMFDNVIDINRIPELSGIAIDPSAIRIGAMTRQVEILEHAGLAACAPIFAAALHYVGHLQTRNRGTLGGSLGHMDPAAELMAVAALRDATIHVQSRNGARDIGIAALPAGFLTPALEPDEMIVAVSFRQAPSGHGWSFQEFAQRHGDFAIIGVAAELDGNDQGSIGAARIALIGVGIGPHRLVDAEALLAGQALSDTAFAAAAECARRLEPLGDEAASPHYRQRLAAALTRRALAEAAQRLATARHAEGRLA